MKKKPILYLLSVFVFSFILLNFLFVSGNLDSLKNKVPKIYKDKLKDSVFYFSNLKRKNDILVKNSKEMNLRNQKILNNLNSIQQEKNLVNANIFPQTHFLNLKYSSRNIDQILLSKKSLYINSETVSPFYLSNFKKKLFITSKTGVIHLTLVSNLQDKDLHFTKLKTNLQKDIEITDTLVIDDKLYVVFQKKDKDCKNISIYFSNLSTDNLDLEFKKFFEYSLFGNGICKKNAIAGRIAQYTYKKKDGLLLSSISFDEQKKEIKDQFGEKLEYKFSDVIFINFNDAKFEKFATGFRNPQGLLVIKENIIISEHGPRGGDEINKVKFAKHYGWPYSSYGENYFKSLEENEDFEFFKTHFEKGFEEPIFSWVPSIAPSQLVKIDKNFSKKWGETVLLSSLKGRSLFKLHFDQNFNKLITIEKIRINKRIRDIIYIKNKKMIILAEENKNGSLGIITSQ